MAREVESAADAQFRVTGIFYSGFDEYDSRLMYAALRDTQELIGRGDEVMGVEMKVKDVDRAEAIAKKLEHVLGGPPYEVQDWYELNDNLFTALNFQKLALVIILTLIIIVATVNMVSALTMMVTDKTREIAILEIDGLDIVRASRACSWSSAWRSAASARCSASVSASRRVTRRARMAITSIPRST